MIHCGIQWIPAVWYCPAPFPRLVKPSKVSHFIGGNVSASPSAQMRMLTLRFARRLGEWHTILSGHPSHPPFHCKTRWEKYHTCSLSTSMFLITCLCLNHNTNFLLLEHCHWTSWYTVIEHDNHRFRRTVRLCCPSWSSLLIYSIHYMSSFNRICLFFNPTS